MSNQFKHRWRNDQLLVFGLLFLLLLIIVAIINWVVGLAGFLLLIALVIWYVRNDARFEKDLKEYITTLSYRLKKVGEEALLEMPIGIVLYDEKGHIEWINHYMTAQSEGDRFLNQPLDKISEDLPEFIQSDDTDTFLTIQGLKYHVISRKTERLLYFFDVTELMELKQKHFDEQTVFAIICLDNYDEVTQGVADQVRSNINNAMTSTIQNWAIEHGIYLKRISSDRFVGILNEKILQELEEDHFIVLDRVREKILVSHIPLTLSIGVGSGTSSLPELGQYAQSALDLALGRGGDQVAIKHPDGKVKFYGGKSNPVEKRTRVRARVISHALSELIVESDQVIVMGHQYPDMDAIGACIGILKIAEVNGKEARIVVDPKNYGAGVIKLVEELRKNEELWSKFISPEEAEEKMTRGTLVVVVDTHKPSMVMDAKLLPMADRVVIIDHHRRAEEFVKDPVLVYMEPYASSTCELVTELIEYQSKDLSLDVIEATSMLAGITVDTKSFTFRTGSRTFDAASQLRSHGADTILVQKLLRDDLNQFNMRAHLIKDTTIYKDHIAIALGTEDQTYDQVLIAQTADTLLTMEGVKASFVVCMRKDNKVGISARSLGEINVQLIMESVGGGGHLTNAATQLEDESIGEAYDLLKQAIDNYLQGGM
ncbi:hypothetical protein GMB86_03475 [Terrilactibacillus sp. BCM23-1]|uniref:Cyclic-di-AMP phosphodiesterase n=1 Tax=Terrilactibacillus tamarindi TaxID=2599694 RepID=A0A6N8CQ69_9BACI|nr:DHH family phosphoesterase [Terrilactibacillus tamarindi]MTT31075.1 hypothetical protein [Terrilactibacillus tamarindi]